MTEKILAVGSAITHYLIETFPSEYLKQTFSENDIGIDELIDQVLLEMIKYSYDQTREKHSLRYYLKELGEDSESNRQRYSNLIKISNEYKEKELSFYEDISGESLQDLRPPKMDNIKDKTDGYCLSEMNFFEITNIGNLRLIKAIIQHQLLPDKKYTTVKRFQEIAKEYDKLVISLKEQCQDSDEKMVFNSLAYYTLEWKYAFDFIYCSSVSMQQNEIKTTIEALSKLDVLLGYQFVVSILGPSSTDSRMVGFREKLIPLFFKDASLPFRYSEILSLVATLKERACINGMPIKQWFIENTDMGDWASFFEDYNVFRYVVEKKDYSKKTVRYMREFISFLFPEDNNCGEFTDIDNEEDEDIAEAFWDNLIESQDKKDDNSMSKISCYIEEYRNDKGMLCARLRDKESNRRIVILGGATIKNHFLRFLSMAKTYIDIMPTVYDREGTDIVAVRGAIKNEDSESIEVDIAVLGAGYLFE